MMALRALPRPPPAPACPAPASANASAWRRPARTVASSLRTRQKSSAWPLAWLSAACEDWNTCCGAWRNNWASACGTRGIRMRFRRSAGLCPQDPEFRRHPPRPGEAPGSRLRPAQRTTCCATPEGTERQEKGIAQDLGGLQIRRITPMALFALQAEEQPRVRWRDWPPRGFATPPARRRTSPAGGAGRHRTGCAVRRGGCRRGFPC